MEIKDEEVLKNKNEAINKINEYLDTCFLIDKKHKKKVNLISYWLKEYINYIEAEETFDSTKLKEYSRGDIIKVNLGFNIGNEEGGLHYCVVLDKKNAKSYSTLTVVPLTSLKPTSKINKTSVFLGNEIYENLFNKNVQIVDAIAKRIDYYTVEIKYIENLPETTEQEKAFKEYKTRQVCDILADNNEKLILATKIQTELSQMKNGSIALVNQITTISKQRIYNPKKDFDILSGIKISDDKMKLIDEKIKKLYIN